MDELADQSIEEEGQRTRWTTYPFVLLDGLLLQADEPLRQIWDNMLYPPDAPSPDQQIKPAVASKCVAALASFVGHQGLNNFRELVI